MKSNSFHIKNVHINMLRLVKPLNSRLNVFLCNYKQPVLSANSALEPPSIIKGEYRNTLKIHAK